jgi:hypothetical protein
MKTAAAERLDEQWGRSFAELQAWVNRTGGLPSRRSNEATEYRLANWLNRQRADSRKATIAAEHERLLRIVPGALEVPGLRLSDVVLADRVGSFHAIHGRLPRRGAEGESTTANYLVRLRAMTRVGDISTEALSAVEAITGAVLDTSSKQSPTVDERLQQVREYLSEHGHLPPSRDGGLHQWIRRALLGEGSVNGETAERARAAVEKLIEGYPAAPRLEPAPRPRPTAAAYIASLEEYVGAHGHLPSSGHDSTTLFRRHWLTELLASPATCEADAARIRALLSAPSWQQGNTGGAERLAAFYAENGRLPRKGSSAPERRLADLLGRLRTRARSGRMSQAAIDALRRVPGALPPQEISG